MALIETLEGCPPPSVERVTPAAQVMINICHTLGYSTVPEGNYDGTNLAGLSGKPLEELTISDLEKVVLRAAGFHRPDAFVRKQSGIIAPNPNGSLNLCLSDETVDFDRTLSSLLEDGTNIVGIRVTPSIAGTNGTKPSRPFRKITYSDHPALIRDIDGHTIGLSTSKKPDGSYDRENGYYFQPDDSVELFIEPTADRKDGYPQAGGINIQILPNHSYQADLTIKGIDIRHVHDLDTIQSGGHQHIEGILTQEETHPILQHFFAEDAGAIHRLRRAIYSIYPDAEILIEAHYAVVDSQIITCAFDVEIPQKTAAQWYSLLSLRRRRLKGTYNQELFAGYLESIYRRFLFSQRDGD